MVEPIELSFVNELGEVLGIVGIQVDQIGVCL